MELKISVPDLPLIIERMRQLPGGAQKAISRSINDALRAGRTAASRAITSGYNIKRGVVLEGIKPFFSNAGNLLGFLHASGTKFPLQMFVTGASRESGVTIEEVRGKQTILAHEFEATMASGHEGVFTRRGRDGTTSPRLPIHEMFGLSIPEMLGQRSEVLSAVEASIEERLGARLEHHVRYLLEQGGLEPE
jgi:hypothetical protein